MHVRKIETTYSTKNARARAVHKTIYDFPEECAEIYRRLFAYDCQIIFGRMSTKERYYTIKVIIDLSRFIEDKSLFDINIKVHTDSGLASPFYTLKDLKFHEITNDAGIITYLHVYRRLDCEYSEVESIVVTTSLDALGDKKYVIPKHDNEKEFCEFSLEQMPASGYGGGTGTRFKQHNGGKYDGSIQKDIASIKYQEYLEAKPYEPPTN